MHYFSDLNLHLGYGRYVTATEEAHCDIDTTYLGVAVDVARTGSSLDEHDLPPLNPGDVRLYAYEDVPSFTHISGLSTERPADDETNADCELVTMHVSPKEPGMTLPPLPLLLERLTNWYNGNGYTITYHGVPIAVVWAVKDIAAVAYELTGQAVVMHGGDRPTVGRVMLFKH